MAERKVREPEQSVNYAMLSLFQYLASILVILVHCQRLFENEVLHFTQKSMFGRMAVPFFLISSAFILKSSLAKNKEMKAYIKRVLKQYLLWSGIYIPYALAYFWSLPVQKHYAPLGLLAGLLYIGLCYHLWYIPAFLLGLLLVHYFYRKCGARKTGVFLVILYVIGSIETYYAYFSNSWLTQSFDTYAKIFFTTRNGIFYAPIFVYLGYLLYDNWQSSFFRKNYGKKLFLTSLLLLLDGWVVFIHQGLDKNFFLALPIFSVYMVNWVLRTRVGQKWRLYHLKELSVLYFFLHPIFIESSFYLFQKTDFAKWQQGRIVFLLSLLLTHLSAEIILLGRRRLFLKQRLTKEIG